MPSIDKPLAGRGRNAAELKAALGAYIRNARVARGMNQAELARAVGMNYYTAISAIEVGRNTVPPERYLAFARALGINPKTFMKNVLRLTNPWAFAMLFAENPTSEFEQINAALETRMGQTQ